MTATGELVRELAHVDVRIEKRGERLRVNAPKGKLTSDLLDRIRLHKSALLREMMDNRFWDRHALAAIEGLEDPEARADMRYAYEERAAIGEYEQGMTRQAAECVAALEVIRLIDTRVRTAEVGRAGT